MIFPVRLFTSMSATTAACELAKPPIAIPRPDTMFSFERLEAATRGCQPAMLAAAARASRHCPKPSFTCAVAMFCNRNS